MALYLLGQNTNLQWPLGLSGSKPACASSQWEGPWDMLEHAESVLDTLCEVLALAMKSTGTHVLGHENTMRQHLWMQKALKDIGLTRSHTWHIGLWSFSDQYWFSLQVDEMLCESSCCNNMCKTIDQNCGLFGTSLNLEKLQFKVNVQ